jgi:hypothetical protein
MPRFVLIVSVLFLVAVTVVVGSYWTPAPAAVETIPVLRPATPLDPSVVVGPPKVKLAVLVVFDQMRGDYIARWKQHFPPGGFRRLMDDGCWFSQCYYPYATTTTGPGHASILCGATPSVTGIINNDWYDRSSGTMVYCASSGRYQPITSRGPGKAKDGSGTPDRLLAPSLGDSVKASGRGGKVIGISLKDRSAIFPAGHYADAAYWFGSEFVTSNYYLDALPPWVKQFNESKIQNRWYGQTWDRFRPDLDYEALAGPDDGPGEANRAGLGRLFPHPINGGKATLTNSYYESLVTSPYGNDLLLAFAKACIDGEQLGRRDAADLLTVSFSSNDLLGHVFGPDSQEVFDVTLRSDRTMAELLAFLDERVGTGQYTVLVTADHGICPLPEVSAAKGIDARRVMQAGFHARADKFLGQQYGKPFTVPSDDSPTKGRKAQWIEAFSAPWIYLNEQQIAHRQLNKEEVAETLATWLRQQSEIGRVYTAKELKEMPPKDAIDRFVKASSYPERSGDVYVVLKPYCLFSIPLQSGTVHGSPYDYDRHVPFVLYGPNLPKGEQTQPVVPQQAAAILADYLGLKPPRDALFEMPESLRR